MTRTKAIERLKDAKIKIKIPKAAVTARETNDALDMAIEALENENALLDRVLDIIDQMDKENEKCNGDISRLLLRIEHKDFRERVLALKGGD